MNLDRTWTKRALVVMGAHRSGVSLVARVLALSGAGAPSDTAAANTASDNPCWLSGALVSLNDSLLAAADSAWDDVFASHAMRASPQATAQWRGAVTDFLQTSFSQADEFILADPRLSVLQEAWSPALTAAGFDVTHLIMVRDPVAIAASLARRYQFTYEHGLLLWLDGMLSAEGQTREGRRVFVSFENLLADWSKALGVIETARGLPLPRRTNVAKIEIERFLSAGRSGRRPAEALVRASALRALALQVYGIFRDAANGVPLEPAALEDVRRQLTQQEQIFSPLMSEYKLRAASPAAVPAAAPPDTEEEVANDLPNDEEPRILLHELESLRSQAVESRQELQQLSAELQLAHVNSAAAEARASRARHQASEAETALLEHEQQLADQARMIWSLEGRLQVAARSWLEREAELKALHGDGRRASEALAALREELRACEEARSDALDALRRAEVRAAALEQQTREACEGQLSAEAYGRESQAESDRLRDALESANGQLAVMAAEIASLQSERSAILESRIWRRLVVPIRRVALKLRSVRSALSTRT